MAISRRVLTLVLPSVVVLAGLAGCSSDKNDNSPSNPSTPSSTPSTQDKGGVPVAPGNGEPQQPAGVGS